MQGTYQITLVGLHFFVKLVQISFLILQLAPEQKKSKHGKKTL
jgi:hypothetical protein